MRVVGIIAEYNPFHSGHAYHLAQAKARANADYALVIMSGDYVQRGEPAMFPKMLRARWALQNGADLVLALPAVYSLTSAAGFARGALGLLDRTNLVDALCFGSECGDAAALGKILDAQDSPETRAALQKALASGQSFPAAREQALKSVLPGSQPGPNDILGLEYLRALRELGSHMEPVALPRKGALHDQGDFSGAYASASALRELLFQGKGDALADFMPQDVLGEAVALCRAGQARSLFRLSPALLYALRRLSREELAALGEVREGLEFSLYKACRQAATLEELLSLVKTRRYPMASLKRACLCALLGITGQDLRDAEQGGVLRVLGLRRQALPLLSRLCQEADVPVITRYGDTELLSPLQQRFLAMDRFAAETACLATQSPQPAPSDFGQPLIILD